MLRASALVAVAALASACIAPTSAAQRLADAAIEMNTAMRFGRMDIAMDFVNASARDTFTQTHAQWGKRIRIVDVEFSGVQVKEKDEADVNVGIIWQVVDDPTMRETRVTQHWKDTRGSWTVVSEMTEGDEGLLLRRGRPSVLPSPAPAPVRAMAPPAPLPPLPDEASSVAPPLPVEVAMPRAPAPGKPNPAARFQTRVISNEE